MKKLLSTVLCAALLMLMSGCANTETDSTKVEQESYSAMSLPPKGEQTISEETSITENECRSYSTAPALPKDVHIIPDSFDIYGRMGLDEVLYGYYEGDTPKDPCRLSLTLRAMDKNWYFIQTIYMDTLIFDENGESLKSYHTEYTCHEMQKNLDVIEKYGLDNLLPINQRYTIKENWDDFPDNAYSAAILLSFDVFAKTEYGINYPDYSISVPAYELRYVEPQVFDAYADISDGKIIEHY